MSRTVATLLAIAGLLIVAIAVAGWFLLVDTSALQSRVESALSEALRTDVEVRGELRVRPLPRPRVILNDVRAGDDVRAEEVEVGVALFAWLRDEPPVRSLTLRRPELVVRRTEDGNLRLAGLRAGEDLEREGDGVALSSLVMTDARLTILDPDEDGLELSGCDLQLDSLTVGDGDGPLPSRLSFSGELACARLRHGPVTVRDFAAEVEAADGVLNAEPVSLHLFGGDGSASLKSDFSAEDPVHRLGFWLEEFPAQAFISLLTEEDVLEGTLSLEARLASEGQRFDALRRNLGGTVSLRGASLTLHGLDLDDKVSDYESATSFGLEDLGAFLLVGPLGMVATLGRDFAELLADSGEYTTIEELRSDWDIEGGVARARDVALSTPQNLVAFRGGLDFNELRFDGVTIAVVDPSGCAFIEQGVSGRFDEPEVEAVDVLEALAAPAINLFERAAELFGDDECDEIFYDGSVAHPRG